ncbi:MAG: DUF4013 domain-containing protein [Oscillochloris sp.]|nr:DUF4013 domain-containing protein [Oscillochloris sp.]
MSFYAPPPAPKLTLPAAMATVHRDPDWWWKCLLHGAVAITAIGLPLAAGFVIESYDNSRKGYPTPLPPWSDWVNRWLSGLFALLVDFAFFILPLLIGALLLICLSVALLIAGITAPDEIARAVFGLVGLIGLFEFVMFMCSVSPVGRIMFVREGQPEQALNPAILRYTVMSSARGTFLRARLASLLAYLPASALAILLAFILPLTFPGQLIAVIVLIWLIASTIVYAHLVTTQLYVAAERIALPGA